MAAKEHMTHFGRFVVSSLILGVLAVSTRWTILPLTPSTFDFLYVNAAISVLWAGLVIVALRRYRKRGLWVLIGVPLVVWWPVMSGLLYWTCMHGFDCM
jgi:hypothetical protein